MVALALSMVALAVSEINFFLHWPTLASECWDSLAHIEIKTMVNRFLLLFIATDIHVKLQIREKICSWVKKNTGDR